MIEHILDYKIISHMSDVSSGIYRIFKNLWDVNRKAYNKVKSIKEDIVRSKESVSHYIMGGSNCRPDRGIQLMIEFKTYAEKMMNHVDFETQVKLKEFQKKADAIIMYIKLAEHELSPFEQFK